MRTLLILLAFFGVATGQDVWTLRHSAPDPPRAMTGIPGLYLIITYGFNHELQLAKGLRSTNGLQWEEVLLPEADILIVGAGEIIGGAGNTVWRTVDGISFTRHQVGGLDLYLTGLALGNQCIVAVGEGGKIFRAPSAAGPWQPQLSPAAYLDGVAYGDGKFIAYAGDNLITSSDGISWTIGPGTMIRSDILGFSDNAFYGTNSYLRGIDAAWRSPMVELRAAGAGYFTGSLDATIYYCKISEAHLGQKWSTRQTGFTDDVAMMAFSGDIWLAASGSGKISTSPVIGALPLAAPLITIAPAMELSWPSVAGRWYQVQKSADNRAWIDFGLPLTGNGSDLKFTAPANTLKQFFRVSVR